MPDVAGRKMLAENVPAGVQVFVPDRSNKWFNKLDNLKQIVLKLSVPRNYEFHKKYFALLNLAFDNWDCIDEYKGHAVEKNFEQFRKRVTVLAGHYDVVADINPDGTGTARKVAKSISFAEMSEEDFGEFYERTKDAIWKNFLPDYTVEDWERVTLEISRF